MSGIVRADRSKIRVSQRAAKVESVAVRRIALIAGTPVRAPRGAALAIAALVSAIGCGQDRLQRANDDVSVVSGTPTVTTGLPGVERLDAGVDGGPVFGSAAPYQVDSFQQQAIQQVDILSIIDNSSSMDLKQARVKANFVSFMQFLVQQQIDFHLGVVTTDTYDPTQSGRLVNLAGLHHPCESIRTTRPPRRSS